MGFSKAYLFRFLIILSAKVLSKLSSSFFIVYISNNLLSNWLFFGSILSCKIPKEKVESFFSISLDTTINIIKPIPFNRKNHHKSES